MANPYVAYKKRQQSAVSQYGPGPSEQVTQPGAMTPDRSSQDAASEALRKAQEEAGWAKGLGTAAGGLLGGVAGLGLGALASGGTLSPELGAGGAALGASLGGGLGSAWGEGRVNQAETEMDKQRRKAMEQEALMQAIMGLRGI